MAAESVPGEGVLHVEHVWVRRTWIALLCASDFVRRARAQVAGQGRVRHATEGKIPLTAYEIRRADLLEPAAVERACLARILLAGADRRAARFVAGLPPHHWRRWRRHTCRHGRLQRRRSRVRVEEFARGGRSVVAADSSIGSQEATEHQSEQGRRAHGL